MLKLCIAGPARRLCCQFPVVASGQLPVASYRRVHLSPALPVKRQKPAAQPKLTIAKQLQDLLLKMPQEELTPQAESKRKKMETRKKRFNTQPATVYWQVLGAGGYGAPASLFLYTDHRRYLFNCGEGTQRVTSQLHQHRALAQLEHVFITSKSWHHLGGLPGLCLSVRAAGAPDITVHGPPGCMELYQAARPFLTLFDFDVHSHGEDEGPWEDGAVRVDQVRLEGGPAVAPPELGEEWREDEQGEVTTGDPGVAAFIVRLSPKPGRLDIGRCAELGVKPGPDLGKLKAGQDVTLPGGRVVRSAEVVGPTAPASAYLVLDLPSLAFLPSLQTEKQLTSIPNLDTVFHFSPPEVVASPGYQDYLAALGPGVRHVVLNQSCLGLGLHDVHSYTDKMRLLRPELFPALAGQADSGLAHRLRQEEGGGAGRVVEAESGLKVQVRPVPEQGNGLDRSEISVYDPGQGRAELEGGLPGLEGDELEEYRTHIQADLQYAAGYGEGLVARLARLEGKQTQAVRGSENQQQYPVVTFLGTGSSSASKYRNVSGILVETEPGNFLILDCGEGTLGQLVRLRGRAGAEAVLRGLKAVWVSHLHADHHLGLISLLLYREAALAANPPSTASTPPLYLVCTDRIVTWLTMYHAKFESILCNVQLVKAERLILYHERDEDTLEENPNKRVQRIFPSRLTKFLADTRLTEFHTARAIHCPNAFCVSFRTLAGYKIGYSGDTRPCEKFRDILQWGGPPDLLIHEATMEHHMIYDAKIKKHSTFTEAIEEGRTVGADFIMLTHFSQRYSKLPVLEEMKDQPRVGIAFDMMEVRPSTMHLIPALYPALSRHFATYMQEMAERTHQYKVRYSEDGQSGLVQQLDLDPALLVQTPLGRKKALLEQLERRHEDKHEWFLKVKKRKLLEKQQEEEEAARAAKK